MIQKEGDDGGPEVLFSCGDDDDNDNYDGDDDNDGESDKGESNDGDNDNDESNGNQDDSDSLPYCQAPRGGYLTPPAIQAVVKSWNIAPYSPLGSVTTWLEEVHTQCGWYGIPVVQWVLCAMENMEAGCQEAAGAAGCEEMMWDEFTTWLHKYSGNVSSWCIPSCCNC